jgi:hypothetical protein
VGDKKDDKEAYLKVQIPDLFYGDRKKFKVYYTQVRLYIWADNKRIKRILKNKIKEVI